jgi:hypothetical protein
MQSLKDKVVFVTGASSGIGEATAEAFAALGARILMCARRAERLEKLAEKLEYEHKVAVHYFRLDVRDRAGVDRAVAGLPPTGRRSTSWSTTPRARLDKLPGPRRGLGGDARHERQGPLVRQPGRHRMTNGKGPSSISARSPARGLPGERLLPPLPGPVEACGSI